MTTGDDIEPMTLSLAGPSGEAITFGRSLPQVKVDDYDFVDRWISITADGLDARASVRTIEGGDGPYCLSQFLNEPSATGEARTPTGAGSSVEHDLSIHAGRDPLGHVLLRFGLRQNYRAESWEVQVTAKLDAGEEMSAFATGMQRLLAV